MNSNCYALLVSAGDYKKMKMKNLPAYANDLALMHDGLCSGLKFDPDNIRMLCEDGYVTAGETALALAAFSKLLKKEDIFVFYFSGHGRNNMLLFSDMGIELQSMLDYIRKIPAHSRIVILDCCYAGDFEIGGSKRMTAEDTAASFAGEGITILAAAAEDMEAWLGGSNRYSIYTEMLSSAMKCRSIRKCGRVSISDINDEVSLYLNIRNKKNRDRIQTPIYRAHIGGTVFFEVQEYHPFKPKEVMYETDKYYLCKVQPMSSLNEKRLSAFAILKKEADEEELRRITLDIAKNIRYEEVFSTNRSRQLHTGKCASVIWCYFGKDESDLIHHLYFADTVWGADEASRKKYFHENARTHVRGDICIRINREYQMLRTMQEPEITTEEYIQQTKELLAEIATLAEQFIADLHEVFNGTAAIEELLKKYAGWIRDVDSQYFKMSDWNVPSDEIYEWAEEVFNLAGYVQNISFLLRECRRKNTIDDRHMWLIRNSIQRYYDSLEKIKEKEEVLNN